MLEANLSAKNMVVDKNFLESDELAVFLTMHPDNRAILTEFAAIEGYAGNAFKNIVKSMSLVCRFPQQVAILKSARKIAGMGWIDPNLHIDLVDWEQTRGLKDFCEAMRKAVEGDATARASIDMHARAATTHLEMMRVEADKMSPYLDKVRY